MSAVIKDITDMRNCFSVVFEDPETGERDIAYFKGRATKEELEELKVYHPSDDDVTMTISMDEDIYRMLEKWCGERGITTEQAVRALLTAIVKYKDENIPLMRVEKDNAEVGFGSVEKAED